MGKIDYLRILKHLVTESNNTVYVVKHIDESDNLEISAFVTIGMGTDEVENVPINKYISHCIGGPLLKRDWLGLKPFKLCGLLEDALHIDCIKVKELQQGI